MTATATQWATKLFSQTELFSGNYYVNLDIITFYIGEHNSASET